MSAPTWSSPPRCSKIPCPAPAGSRRPSSSRRKRNSKSCCRWSRTPSSHTIGVQVGDKTPLVGEDDWIAAGWPEIAEATAAESVASMRDELAEPSARAGAAVRSARVGAAAGTSPACRRWLRAAPAPSRRRTAPPSRWTSSPSSPSRRSAAPEIEPGQAAAEAALGDDLKSRIEETRRRIREELEKPFAAVDEPPIPEPVRPVAAPAPVIGEAIRTSVPANGGAPAQPAAPAAAVPAAGAGGQWQRRLTTTPCGPASS